MPAGHPRAAIQHGHGPGREVQDDNNAASGADQLQAASFAEPVNPVEEQPSALTARHGRSLSEMPSAQVHITVLGCCGLLVLTQSLTLPRHSQPAAGRRSTALKPEMSYDAPSLAQGSSMKAPAEPPDRQGLIKPATAQHEGSAQTSDLIIDIVGNPEDDEEHASATSKASEPASEPELAKAGSESADPEPGAGAAQPEPMEDRGAAAPAAAAAASPSKAGAPVGAGGPRPPSKRRRVLGEKAGPRSKRHGVSSVPDSMGRSSTGTLHGRQEASGQSMHCQQLCARSCSIACIADLWECSTGGGGP